MVREKDIMRKKSHIKVGTCIGKELIDNRYINSFVVGNIIPDLSPSFILRKHGVGSTLNKVKMEMRLTSNDFKGGHGFYFRLGIISHYIADYFTLPHNEFYIGTLAEHCKYEGSLKRIIKEKIQNNDIRKEELLDIPDYDSLIEFIMSKHVEYSIVAGSIETDCDYIYNVTRQVVFTMKYLQSTVYDRISDYIKGLEAENLGLVPDY